jgi:hypothetical protein
MSSKLTLFCNGVSLGPATGFIWTTLNRTFLISNWHVIAGRNTYTGQAMHSSGAVPDAVHFSAAFEHLGRLEWREVRIQLFDQAGNATWLQHPTLGQDVDIAALEMPIDGISGTVCSLAEGDLQSNIAVTVSSEVFVVGFPLGIAKQFTLPIWKRGSVASEFSVPFDGLPIFVVDTATREGMSGSPVYARSSGAHLTTTGDFAIGNGPSSRFLGVYSGRYGAKDEFSAQLGRVWHAELIPTIISGNANGNYQLRS